MKVISNCVLCENKEFKRLFSDSDKIYEVSGQYTVDKCKKCNLIFINPQPSEKELEKHYPKNKYYAYQATKKPSLRRRKLYSVLYEQKGINLKKIFLSPLKQVLRSTDIIPKGKFLDVGCGSGEFMILMQSFNMKCYGVEPGNFNEKFVKENKLRVYKGRLEEAHYPKNFFDVITMNHVFEHLSKPRETLKELRRILKPNGTLIVGLPCSTSFAAKIFGKYWVGLDIPRHLFTYSKENITHLVRKEGFIIKKIRYNSDALQFLGSFLYLTNTLRKNKVYLKEKKYGLKNVWFCLWLPFAIILNCLKIGDQFELILTKK